MHRFDLASDREEFQRRTREVVQGFVERTGGRSDLRGYQNDLDERLRQYHDQTGGRLADTAPAQNRRQEHESDTPRSQKPKPKRAAVRGRGGHRTSPDELRSVIRAMQARDNKGKGKPTARNPVREERAREREREREKLKERASSKGVPRPKDGPVSWERSLRGGGSRSATPPARSARSKSGGNPPPRRSASTSSNTKVRRRAPSVSESPPPVAVSSSRSPLPPRHPIQLPEHVVERPNTNAQFPPSGQTQTHSIPPLTEAGLSEPVSPQRCSHEAEAIPYPARTYAAVPWHGEMVSDASPSPSASPSPLSPSPSRGYQPASTTSLSSPTSYNAYSTPALPSTVLGTHSVGEGLPLPRSVSSAFPHLYNSDEGGRVDLQAVSTTYRSALCDGKAERKPLQQISIYPQGYSCLSSMPSRPYTGSAPTPTISSTPADIAHDNNVRKMMDRIRILQSYLPKQSQSPRQPSPQSNPLYHDFR